MHVKLGMPLLLGHPLSSLSFLLKRSYIAPQKYFSRGELTAAQLTAFHEVIDVLAGHLEVPHHIAHAHEFGEVFFSLFHSLSLVLFPEYRFNLPMNRLLTPERAEEIKQQANTLLSSYLHIQDPMERVTKIARDNGIDILESNLFEISGALRKEGDRWAIYVNSTDSMERKLFTIAHELGHFFSHKDVCDEFVDGQLISRNEQEKYAALELEANEFAGNLIMPESEVRSRVTTDSITTETVRSLARSFGVSTRAMATRLQNLGYETPVSTTRTKTV